VLESASRSLGLSPVEGSRRLGPLIASFISADGAFLALLDQVLDDFIAEGRDLSSFQDFLSVLSISAQPAGSDSLASLVSQGRVLVSAAEKRMSNYRMWKERARDRWLNILNHELLCSKDFRSILESLGRYLPHMGIGSGYLVLDEGHKERRRFIGSFETSLGASEGASSGGEETSTRVPPPGKADFPAQAILPEEYWPQGIGAFAVLPLHYESTFLGYTVLGVKGGEPSLFEELRVQLSSAMRGVLLFEQANLARLRAEKAEKMKTAFLAAISGELQEPIRFINDLSGRLLADADLAHRQEIEAIAAYSADQLELTRRLLDLSLAQVDDLATDFALFDPAIFISEFIQSTAAKAGERRWKQLKTAVPDRRLPLLFGDGKRLTQILEIFLDLLSRELGLDRVDLRLETAPGGLVFSLGGSGGSARKASRLERIADTRLNPPSPDEAWIDVELVRRIAFLHGGSLSFKKSAPDGSQGYSLSLLLPYPSLDGTLALDRQTSVPAGIAYLGDAVPVELAQIFPGTIPVRLSMEEAGGKGQSADSPSLIFLDPRAFATEDWATAALLIENPLFRKLPCFVPSSNLGLSQAGSRASLGEYLESLMPKGSKRVVFILGATEETQEEVLSISERIVAEGWRIFRCETPAELALLADREKPSLLVLAGQRGDFLMAAAGKAALADAPILCVSGKFNDTAFEAAIAGRPRSLVCNAGPVFAGVGVERAMAILHGDDILPTPTGILVTKAIFFLNHHFRESVSRWKLSETVNASEDYLSRIFHHQMGIPLWDYLNRLRIGRSLGLLRSSGDSIAEIASRAGFQDQAYFCRVFRRVTGLTPGAFRKDGEINVRKVQHSDC
jgi:AraC-like DNA-binding protein